MATITHEPHAPAAVPVADLPRASLEQRAGALAIDIIVLSAGYGAAVLLGLSLADEGVVSWLLATWVFIVTPLYFALYHAFGGPERGPGWTPGQHELGICVCDAETGGRIGLGRALARTYGGLLAVLLVVPVLLDLVSLIASPDGRAWHDRLSGSTVARASALSWVPTGWPQTVAECGAVFDAEGDPGAHALARARLLVRGNRRLITGSALAVYVGLVFIAALLVPLLISDMAGSLEEEGAVYTWIGVSLVLFASGVYWTLAVLVTAIEAIRVGEEGLNAGRVIRRAAIRANALTVALLLLTLFGFFASVVLFPFLLVLFLARYALVVPVIVLEEAPSLGAFGRSRRLTRGSTGRALGLVLVSALTWVAVWIAAGIAVYLVSTVSPGAGAEAFALGVVAALAILAVPVSLGLSLAGAAWCLFYYDLRRQKCPLGEGGEY